jgi:hypothetical protein
MLLYVRTSYWNWPEATEEMVSWISYGIENAMMKDRTIILRGTEKI